MGGNRGLLDVPSLNGIVTFDQEWKPQFHPIRLTFNELDSRIDTMPIPIVPAQS
jgi:hypothetical protein